MRTTIAGFFLILSVVSVLAAEKKGAQVADAEKAAQQYMTAFFHGDVRTAASLTHPETLQQLRRTFAQERAPAVAAGKEAEFLAQFGTTASTDFDALAPAEFYVVVVSGSRRAQPEGVEAMKAATVAVKGSEPTAHERVVVTLAITAPAGGGTQTQDARLLLAFVDGQWKVVGNAP